MIHFLQLITHNHSGIGSVSLERVKVEYNLKTKLGDKAIKKEKWTKWQAKINPAPEEDH